MDINYCMDWGLKEGESIPPDWKGPPIGRKVIETPPAGTNMPSSGIIAPPTPSIPITSGSTLPRITRHKGQRTQTVKTIYTQVPIQYRTALDRLKEKTRMSLKEVICEAIGLSAVKHGLTKEAGSIMGWADWD